MSFDVITTTLSAAVANAGTFTVGYPAGRSAGDYNGAHAHKMYAINANFTAPENFTLAFGATLITVTYNGATTLPASTEVRLQVDQLGEDTLDPDEVVLPANMRLAPLHLIDLGSPDTADANGYIISQDLTALGVFSISVTAAAALAAAALAGSADVPRNVVAAWTGTAVLTVTGTDDFDKVMVESSGSGTSFTGKKAFKTVTNISVSANVTALTVGTGDVIGLPSFLQEASYVLDDYEDGVSVGNNPQRVFVPFQIDQVDLLAATPISVASPVAGVIKRVVTKVWKAVTTGGPVTATVNGVAVDGLSVVVASSAPAGATDSDTPTAGHASTIVAVDDELELIPDAAFATAGALTGHVEIETSTPGRLKGGTIVVGDAAKATALTGDVRGTYDPTTVCDGSTSFALLVALPDPNDKGVTQFGG